jgi:hypothetical protein
MARAMDGAGNARPKKKPPEGGFPGRSPPERAIDQNE